MNREQFLKLLEDAGVQTDSEDYCEGGLIFSARPLDSIADDIWDVLDNAGFVIARREEIGDGGQEVTGAIPS